MELEEKSKNKLGSLQPVYHSTEKLSAFGLQSRGIENLMRNLLPQVLKFIPKTLPNNIEKILYLLFFCSLYVYAISNNILYEEWR